MATQNPLITTLQAQRNSALDAVADLNVKLTNAAEIIGKLEKENKELNEKIKDYEKPITKQGKNEDGPDQHPND